MKRRRDRPLKTVEDIERSVGFEVLAVFPLFREKRTNGRAVRGAPELVAAEAPGSAAAEAVAKLPAPPFHASPAGPPQRPLGASARLGAGETCVRPDLAGAPAPARPTRRCSPAWRAASCSSSAPGKPTARPWPPPSAGCAPSAPGSSASCSTPSAERRSARALALPYRCCTTRDEGRTRLARLER